MRQLTDAGIDVLEDFNDAYEEDEQKAFDIDDIADKPRYVEREWGCPADEWNEEER